MTVSGKPHQERHRTRAAAVSKGAHAREELLVRDWLGVDHQDPGGQGPVV